MVPKGTKKWIRSNLSKVNVIGYSISNEGVFSWHVSKGPFNNKLFFNNIYQSVIDNSIDHTALFRYLSSADNLAEKILIHVMEGTTIGYSSIGGLSDLDTIALYDEFRNKFDEAYHRMNGQIMKLKRSSKVSRLRLEVETSAIKREFTSLMKHFTNSYKKISKDRLFDIIENSVRELKVSEVMES